MNSRQLAIIPLLILVYYFVHYTTDLFYFITARDVLIQFGKYLLCTALLFAVGYRLFKNKAAYTLGFATVFFIFLFFGSVIDTAASLHFLKPVAVVDTKMIIVFLAVCLLVIFICSKLNAALIKRLLRFWLIYCLVLILYDAGIFLLSEKKEKKYLTGTTLKGKLAGAAKPAVFFLLFDMYPSDTVLKRYLGYDNSGLGAFLKGNDFFVTGNAHSLYSETYYSLASTFSLQPLPYFNDSTIPDYKKKLAALKNIEHEDLPGLFENAGYRFRNFSVFNLQGQQSPLQFNLNYHLENALTATTFFNRWYDGFEPDFFLANRGIDLGFIKTSWSSNEKADIAFLEQRFNQLMDSFPALQQPSFNYFHFMMPHPPMLYDSNGHENSIKDMYAYNGFEKTNQNYTGYIKYANTVIKKMVSRIFEKAGRNVVIIVQGDHGYREFNDRFPDAVRYGILNAVYMPAKQYNGLNDSMTPVHTFKQVLSQQFGFAEPDR